MRRYDGIVVKVGPSTFGARVIGVAGEGPVHLEGGEPVTVLPRAVADALVAVAEAAKTVQCATQGSRQRKLREMCDALARLDAANAGGGA
jgi:hypothetical protein